MATSVDGITLEELQLAARNHALPLEALRYPITPVGLHYLLIHFDIPAVDAADVAARGRRPRRAPAQPLARRAEGAPGAHAGGDDGVRRQRPRALRAARAQPAVAARGGRHGGVDGHAARADPRGGGLDADAVEVVFTGLRPRRPGRGRARLRAQPRRSPRRCATRCCSPTRSTASRCRRSTASRCGCSCPSWYGMTHVKWLRSITVVDEPFRGWQQDVAYRMRQSEDEQGTPVTRILPRALMVPPGIPDFLSRTRLRRRRAVRCSRAARGRARRRSCASR